MGALEDRIRQLEYELGPKWLQEWAAVTKELRTRIEWVKEGGKKLGGKDKARGSRNHDLPHTEA